MTWLYANSIFPCNTFCSNNVRLEKHTLPSTTESLPKLSVTIPKRFSRNISYWAAGRSQISCRKVATSRLRQLLWDVRACSQQGVWLLVWLYQINILYDIINIYIFCLYCIFMHFHFIVSQELKAIKPRDALGYCVTNQKSWPPLAEIPFRRGNPWSPRTDQNQEETINMHSRVS